MWACNADAAAVQHRRLLSARQCSWYRMSSWYCRLLYESHSCQGLLDLYAGPFLRWWQSHPVRSIDLQRDVWSELTVGVHRMPGERNYSSGRFDLACGLQVHRKVLQRARKLDGYCTHCGTLPSLPRWSCL